MIVEIKDKRIEERMKHLNKAIEIVGGAEYLKEDGIESKILGDLIKSIFEGDVAKLNISDKEYTLEELFKIKTEFEKYFLKNKFKAILSIVQKIKKYNTQLESKIRKFKKSNSIEEFREISKEVEEKYAWEFDRFLLAKIDDPKDNIEYYGEYLSDKRKQLIDSIFVKLGI